MLAAQAGLEVRMLLRNGEQLLLTLGHPRPACWPSFGSVEVMDLGNRAARVDFLAPGVLALAVMSTAFTGQAIGTGFERRYGVLKRLGATPLPAAALLGGQEPGGARRRGLQVALLGTVALAHRLATRAAVAAGRPAAGPRSAPPRSAAWRC